MNVIGCTINHKHPLRPFFFLASMFIKIFKPMKSQFIVVVSCITDSHGNFSIYIIIKEKLLTITFFTKDNHFWYDWSIPTNTLGWRNKISILQIFENNTSLFLLWINLLLSSTTSSKSSLIKITDISICYSMRCFGLFKIMKVLLDCLRTFRISSFDG